LHPPLRFIDRRVPARRKAFTLIELMVVIGVIALLLVLLAPTIGSLSKSTGRRGAVSNLTSIIEQTRALALSQSRTAYVAFVGEMPPNAPPAVVRDYAYRAFAVFQDSAGAGKAQVTKWQKLPEGISFRAEPEAAAAGTPVGTSITATTNSATTLFPFAPLGSGQSIECRYIAFDATGTVIEPPVSAPLRLVIFEGRVNNAVEQPTARDADQQPVRDEIQIGRYNGRAKVVVR
jgi:prepilin-type N-terminal cleavage/methylation domain-containing protein